MNFYEAFTAMLYTRMEEPGFYNPLEESEAYRAAQEVYREARAEAGENGDILAQAMGRVFDMQAQYLYRMGVQDGLSVSGSGFLTKGIE